MSSTIQYGANLRVIGKTNANKLSHAMAFKPITGTLSDLAKHIGKGHPWMPALLDGNHKRWQSNANHAEILGADIDAGMTLEQAIAHPFIKAHCGLIIESASSKPEHHKFRLVFRLTQPVKRWQNVRLCNRYLIHVLGVADPSCKDASRFFFGAPGRDPFLLNESVTLPETFIDDAIAWGEGIEREEQRRAELARQQWQQWRDDNPEQDSDALILQALDYIDPNCDYNQWLAVGMSLAGMGDHWFADWDRWSSGASSYKPKECFAKWRSFRGCQPSPGTIFGLAKKGGFQFPKKEYKDPREPNSADYEAYVRAEQERNQAEACGNSKDAQAKRDRFQAETERIQQELNTIRIEPTISATGRYIPKGLLNLPEKSGIVLVDGTMGVGKTSTVLKGLVEQHNASHPYDLRWLFTPRNLLGLQAGETLGLPHHSHATGSPFQQSSCLESVGLIDLNKLPDGKPILFFDEPGQMFKQILEGNTCKNSQAFVIERTRQLFKLVAERGGWIVLSEDGLTNLELDFVREGSGLEVVEFLKFTKDVVTPRSYEIYDSPSLTWDEMLIRLEQDENLCVTADSQGWLEETERMLEARGIKGVFIHGKNSHEDWAHECIKNPIAWIEREKPRVFGYSPSLGSGVSIDDVNGYFHGMAIHITHLEPRAAKQLPDRLRSDVPRFGYVKEWAAKDDDLYSGSRPDLILRDLRRNNNGVAKLINFAAYAEQKQSDGVDLVEALQRIAQDWDNPESELHFYLKHWSRYKAREAYGKLNLRQNLIDIWEGQGHTVNLLDLGTVTHLAEERTEIREALDKDEAIARADTNTADTSVSEAREILNRDRSTPEQRRKAHKRLLEDKLPGVNLDDPEFVLKVCIQDRGHFLKSTELLWRAKNPEAAKQLDRWNWSNAFSQSAQTGRIVIIHRLSNHSAQAKLLNECPLTPFIEGKVTEWDNNTLEAIAVHEWARLRFRQFKRHLRLTIAEHHNPVATVNKLLRKLSYKVDLVQWKGSREERQRQYAITNLQDCDRDAILQALTERFIKRCEGVGEAPLETVIATRTTKEPYASCDHQSSELAQLLTLDSLQDIKSMWNSAESPEEKAVISQLFPADVILRAIAA